MIFKRMSESQFVAWFLVSGSTYELSILNPAFLVCKMYGSPWPSRSTTEEFAPMLRYSPESNSIDSPENEVLARSRPGTSMCPDLQPPGPLSCLLTHGTSGSQEVAHRYCLLWESKRPRWEIAPVSALLSKVGCLGIQTTRDKVGFRVWEWNTGLWVLRCCSKHCSGQDTKWPHHTGKLIIRVIHV